MIIPPRPGPIPYDVLDQALARLNQPDVHRPHLMYSCFSVREGVEPVLPFSVELEMTVRNLRGCPGKSAKMACLMDVTQKLHEASHFKSVHFTNSGMTVVETDEAYWTTSFTFRFVDVEEEVFAPNIEEEES